MKRQIIIVAGGRGLRMGEDLPKQFLPVGGRPVLMRTLERFQICDPEMKIILVLPSAQREYWQELCLKYALKVPYSLVDGGETRFHSVLHGLMVAEPDGVIGVHDGVRPFASEEVIRRCFDTAIRDGSAVPVVPLVDSLRRLHSEGGSEVADRTEYCLVQTPQVFRADWLFEAYRQPFTESFTDDASVVEGVGHSITLVEGNRENIKLTTPLDLKIAELFCQDV